MAWSFVNASSSANTSVTKGVTAGNLLVACFAAGDGTSNPTIADGGVDTWEQVLASPVHDTTNASGVMMWSARAASTAVITVNISTTSTTFNGTALAEYSHTNGAVIASGREDKSLGKPNIAGNSGTNAMTPGNMSTTTDGCIVIGFINDDGNPDTVTQYTAGTSTLAYSKRATASKDPGGSTNTTFALEDGVQTTHGTIQAAWTENVANVAVAIQAAFKAPVAGGSANVVLFQMALDGLTGGRMLGNRVP